MSVSSLSGQDAFSNLFETKIARLMQLQQECMAQQSRQGQILQSQLQGLMAKQANLRSLLKQQHEQILQRLPSASYAHACASGQTVELEDEEPLVSESQQHVYQSPLLSALPEKPQLVQTDAAALQQTSIETSLADVEAHQAPQPEAKAIRTSEGDVRAKAPRKKSGGLSKTAQGGMVLDVSTLPDTWICEPEDTRTHHHHPCLSKAPWLKRAQDFVRSTAFDSVCTAVVLANLITLAVQLQLRGYHAAVLLGVNDHDSGYPNARHLFDILEIVYTTIFAIEALVRISLLGWQFLRVGANLFDTLIVLVTCIQMYILQPIGLMKDTSFVAIARLIRLVRVMRLLKVVRFAEFCAELRILVRALLCCVDTLFWSLVIVTMIILTGAIIILQIILAYVEDENNPPDLRMWCYNHFGSIELSMLALWEVTFTGTWHRYTRKMIIEMSPLYAIFWVPYVVCINYAVMRLTSALFLKETMSVAANETEKMTLTKMSKHKESAECIRDIFIEADKSGDGKLSLQEFQGMLYNQRIGNYFAKLELEVAEVAVLFELLVDDDGKADYYDFLEGLLKLKRSAQTIDTIQLIHGTHKLDTAIRTVYGSVCELARAQGVDLVRPRADEQGFHDSDRHLLLKRPPGMEISVRSEGVTLDNDLANSGEAHRHSVDYCNATAAI